jgi:hypothetical protein
MRYVLSWRMIRFSAAALSHFDGFSVLEYKLILSIIVLIATFVLRQRVDLTADSRRSSKSGRSLRNSNGFHD